MTTYKFHPCFASQDIQSKAKQDLEAFEKKLPANSLKEVDLDINKPTKPDHACIWNDIDLIGQDCRILATNGFLSIVIFPATRKIAFYRNEDLVQEL
jgi:hypothetical protein